MSALRRLYRGENEIDFARWWKRGLILSAVLIVISLLSLFTRGLNLGIDFEGGVSVEGKAPGVSVSRAQSAMDDLGISGAKIQIIGTDTLRVQVSADQEPKKDDIRQSLADLAGTQPTDFSVSTVGPSWGQEITRSAERALVIFLLFMLAYLSIRLEWKMAMGAVLAMIHDVIISVGVYSVLQLEVTPPTVIAFLTILGYSIYDTIVVFDKVKENQARPAIATRMTYTDLVVAVDERGAAALDQHLGGGPAAGDLDAGGGRRHPGGGHPRGVRASPCSSACCRAPTRRSSWPCPSWSGSRSASPATPRCASAWPPPRAAG